MVQLYCSWGGGEEEKSGGDREGRVGGGGKGRVGGDGRGGERRSVHCTFQHMLHLDFNALTYLNHVFSMQCKLNLLFSG